MPARTIRSTAPCNPSAARWSWQPSRLSGTPHPPQPRGPAPTAVVASSSPSPHPSQVGRPSPPCFVSPAARSSRAARVACEGARRRHVPGGPAAWGRSLPSLNLTRTRCTASSDPTDRYATAASWTFGSWRKPCRRTARHPLRILLPGASNRVRLTRWAPRRRGNLDGGRQSIYVCGVRDARGRGTAAPSR